MDLEGYDVSDDRYLGEVVDVDEGVVRCVQETYDAPEYRVYCCTEEGWCDRGENGRDDIGTERLNVKMRDRAVEVGNYLD